MLKHRLFLIDLDDTLLDFRASEKLAFEQTMKGLGVEDGLDEVLAQYQVINTALWKDFEAGGISKDVLKVERFRRTFLQNKLDIDPDAASRLYHESLSEHVVLIDGARRLCETLSACGEVGIITNGVDHVQHRRIASSGLRQHISFIATSEACGHAKPDTRFFDYTVKMARSFASNETVIIGDRLDADILGANRFGIESCWLNPGRLANDTQAIPTYEVARLDDVIAAMSQADVLA